MCQYGPRQTLYDHRGQELEFIGENEVHFVCMTDCSKHTPLCLAYTYFIDFSIALPAAYVLFLG